MQTNFLLTFLCFTRACIKICNIFYEDFREENCRSQSQFEFQSYNSLRIFKINNVLETLKKTFNSKSVQRFTTKTIPSRLFSTDSSFLFFSLFSTTNVFFFSFAPASCSDQVSQHTGQFCVCTSLYNPLFYFIVNFIVIFIATGFDLPLNYFHHKY